MVWGNITSHLQDWIPGVYVHSIKIGQDENQDRSASYFGQILQQVFLLHLGGFSVRNACAEQ